MDYRDDYTCRSLSFLYNLGGRRIQQAVPTGKFIEAMSNTGLYRRACNIHQEILDNIAAARTIDSNYKVESIISKAQDTMFDLLLSIIDSYYQEIPLSSKLAAFIYGDTDVFIIDQKKRNDEAYIEWRPLNLQGYMNSSILPLQTNSRLSGVIRKTPTVLNLYFESGIVISLNCNLRNLIKHPNMDYVNIYFSKEPDISKWKKIYNNTIGFRNELPVFV